MITSASGILPLKPGLPPLLFLKPKSGRLIRNADAVRDDLIRYIKSHLRAKAAVLAIDETGFLKKGSSRLVSPDSIRGRRAESKIVRSAFF